MNMMRCLILGCTEAKRDASGSLPALERYNGPTFQVVRRFLREAGPQLKDVDIYVLSAEYGLISVDKPIADYDRRMTTARAAELRPEVSKRLREILSQGYDEVFVSLSQVYLEAVGSLDALGSDGARVIVSRAAMGRRLTELKRWLYHLPDEPLAPERSEPTVRGTGQATLCGQRIAATTDEVVTLARQALADGLGKPRNFRSWYALVDGEKVSTKWLVSLLLGLDVSEFQASEARRVLGQLGVDVYHDG
jgi:hypothetical protein